MPVKKQAAPVLGSVIDASKALRSISSSVIEKTVGGAAPPADRREPGHFCFRRDDLLIKSKFLIDRCQGMICHIFQTRVLCRQYRTQPGKRSYLRGFQSRRGLVPALSLKDAKNNTVILFIDNVSTLSAVFFHQPDIADPHGFLGSFCHIVNCQGGN